MEIRASAPTSSLIGRGERPTQLTTVTHPSTYRSVPGQCRAGFPGHRREAPRRPPPPSPPPQRSPAAATASSGLDSIRTYLTPCVGAAPFRRDFFPALARFPIFFPFIRLRRSARRSESERVVFRAEHKVRCSFCVSRYAIRAAYTHPSPFLLISGCELGVMV